MTIVQVIYSYHGLLWFAFIQWFRLCVKLVLVDSTDGAQVVRGPALVPVGVQPLLSAAAPSADHNPGSHPRPQ